ncbi:transporter [Seonamhaeicola sediminis]|uniref:Transporter n=1 Tax=Seonamhaeicola sediminis TaxID=2528206 RepID=A0A562YH39_9FLAO|nr:transporter [Seonamhaeicola sediminis]TWO33878.1 transporter [Seonamhaeicola sediminis]
MKTNKTLLAVGFLLLSYNLFSQETENGIGTLITDRPDATESPNTVPVGYIQVETGAFYESFKEDNSKFENFTLNTTLIRIGLIDNLELRLGWDFNESTTTISNMKLDNIMSGFSPLLFGAKVNIANEKGCFPEIGLIGHLFLPFTAGTDYKTETTGVDFRFSFAHTLSETTSLSYNIGAQWGDDSSEAAYIYTIAYGIGITEKLGAYAELYGDLPENNSANHFWDAGLTYLISDSVQLDATVGTSITKGQDILLSGGVSFRIPTKKN